MAGLVSATASLPIHSVYRIPHPYIHEAGGFLYQGLLVFPSDQSTKDSSRGVA